MILRWVLVLKVAGALLIGGVAVGATAACGTVEGIGKDISAAGRAAKKVFD